MNETNDLRRILILGGGPAAWLAAIYLNRYLRHAGCSVTVVESIKLGTASIGEPTHPALVKFLRGLKIEEAELMSQCAATYQLGAQFVNWSQPQSASWRPFGLCGGTINDIDVFHFWLKSSRAGRGEGPYSSYSLQALLAQADKAPRATTGVSPIMERGEYAYHLDPPALADFLREIATAEGVNQLFDDVRQSVIGGHGAIERLETKSGRALTADLYLDCTSEGLLIERDMGDAWVSWSPLFLCDRAVVLPMPRDADVHPYVRATALSAGWMRQFSLSHRVSSSYFYSSGHISDEAATRELLTSAARAKAAPAEPRYVKLRQGRRQTFWKANCVALGAAAGTIEPLAGMDFLLLPKMLELLVEFFPDQALNPVLSQAYNERAAGLFDMARDFSLLHYVTSGRDDESFWRDSRSVMPSTALTELLALHDENGYIAPAQKSVIDESAYHHVFTGANRLPRRPTLAAESLDFAQVCEILDKMKKQNEDWVQKMPPHRELMERLHRPQV